MNKFFAIIGFTFVTLICLGAIGGCTIISYKNQDVSLRNKAKAEQKNAEVVFDKTFKVIRDSVGVTDKYTENLKELVKNTMNARYGDEGSKALFQFLHEQNPTLDSNIFIKLQTTIEANRAEFANTQKQLLDIKREHDDLIGRFPGSLIVGSSSPIELTIITSTNTSEVYANGKDDSKIF